MALRRESLKAMGLTDDQVSAIIEMHVETVDALKQERDAYKADADKLVSVQKQLDEIKDDGGYKEKYEKEHSDFEAFKTATENEKTLAAKKTAYEEVCKDAGLNEKGIAKALKYCDWDSVELDDKGKVKSATNHIKNLKEEWAEHVVVENTNGANTPNPPSNNGGSKMTLADIDKIEDTAERQKAILENHELFGF